MTRTESRDADVIVLGGGTFGATTAALLARDGVDTVVVEGDVHPVQHVGEALAPAANTPFDRLGVLDKLDDSGFPHHVRAAWNARTSPPGAFVEIKLFDGVVQASRPYAYLAERGELDTILLRHAHEAGAKVLQGVEATRVLSDDRGTAIGVHVGVADGWERDLTGAVVVDATGDGKCTLGQARTGATGPVRLSSVFGDVVPPSELEGPGATFYQLAARRWAWQIPMKNGRTSVGVALEPGDLPSDEDDLDATFASLVGETGALATTMKEAARLRPFEIAGSGSLDPDRRSGQGWIAAADAARFAVPMLLSWADVAIWSAVHAHEAILAALDLGANEDALDRYSELIAVATGPWADLSSIVRERVDVGTRLTDPVHRSGLTTIVHGDPFHEVTLKQVRALVDDLRATHTETLAKS